MYKIISDYEGKLEKFKARLIVEVLIRRLVLLTGDMIDGSVLPVEHCYCTGQAHTVPFSCTLIDPSATKETTYSIEDEFPYLHMDR